MSVRESWLLIGAAIAIVIGLYLLLDQTASAFLAWWNAAPEGEDMSANQERER